MKGKTKILIVENDTPVAMLMVFLLSHADCKTEVAASGRKAMQMAEDGNFDLITLVVNLPDGNGFNLCRPLKEPPRLRHTPLVSSSDRPGLEEQQHGLDFGAADYITKPFETFEFASRPLSHVKMLETQANGNDASLCTQSA